MRIFIMLLLVFSPMALRATEEDVVLKEEQINLGDDLDTQISKLKKLKEYYEVSIKRANRTAWRLEFRDPGYSRQLDQKVLQYKRQLSAVNKELDAKMQQKKKMGS